MLSLSGMSKQAGGDNGRVAPGLCVGYWYKMIEEIKTWKPEVKASKSDERLRSYGHSKFWIFHGQFLTQLYLVPSRRLTHENFDIPGYTVILNL